MKVIGARFHREVHNAIPRTVLRRVKCVLNLELRDCFVGRSHFGDEPGCADVLHVPTIHQDFCAHSWRPVNRCTPLVARYTRSEVDKVLDLAPAGGAGCGCTSQGDGKVQHPFLRHDRANFSRSRLKLNLTAADGNRLSDFTNHQSKIECRNSRGAYGHRLLGDRLEARLADGHPIPSWSKAWSKIGTVRGGDDRQLCTCVQILCPDRDLGNNCTTRIGDKAGETSEASLAPTPRRKRPD